MDKELSLETYMSKNCKTQNGTLIYPNAAKFEKPLEVDPNICCCKCGKPMRVAGQLINLAGYNNQQITQWYCLNDLPNDWTGHPSPRMPAREMFAMHAHVEKHKEHLSKMLSTKKDSDE